MRLALLVAALTLGLAGIASADERRLFVYGDSLAIGTQPFLSVELALWEITADSDYSRKTRTAPRALRAITDLAPIVHVSLGTVDDPTRPGRFRRRVRRTMRAVGDRCVVWANIYRPLFRKNGTVWNGWRSLNRVLNDEAERRANLLVVDWASMVRRHPDWRSPVDGTHVDEAGYHARAHAIARHVRDCADRL